MPTKPIATYKAVDRPLALDENAAICRKRSGSTFSDWSNKTELTDFIDSLYKPQTSDTYLYIVCGCGTEYIYTLKADVPSSNVTCPCGRKVIEYTS